MSSAPTRHAGKVTATRFARRATVSPQRIGTSANCFPTPRGPAALTKTLSAKAPAAAAAAAAAGGAKGAAAEGAAEEESAPATLAAGAEAADDMSVTSAERGLLR